jgi:hypothetical protein
MDHKEFSARGGNTTMARYGKDFYSKIGKRGAASKVKLFGKDYFKRLSQLGVAKRKEAKSIVDKQAQA